MLRDVTARAGDDEIRSLLALLAWKGEPEDVDRIVSIYSTGPRLFAAERDGRVVGLIGIEIATNGGGVIRHIVTSQDARSTGVGRTMVDEAMHSLNLECLVAETDDEAVDFYRSCGFTVWSLGEK
jgi:ribosomal protein S18 acetylase RimI-like enzyme